MIVIIGGSKGGVGKSFVTNCMVHYFYKIRGVSLTVIDADTENPDVFKVYDAPWNQNNLINPITLELDRRQGWLELGDLIEMLHDLCRVFIINTPARSNRSMIEHSAAFLDPVQNELHRPIVTLYVLSRIRDSLQTLEDYQQAFPHRKTSVIMNGFHGPEISFTRYLDSKVKANIEAFGGKSLWFPELASRVVDRMIDDRLSFESLFSQSSLGNRSEISSFLRKIQDIFDSLFGEDPLRYGKREEQSTDGANTSEHTTAASDSIESKTPKLNRKNSKSDEFASINADEQIQEN